MHTLIYMLVAVLALSLVVWAMCTPAPKTREGLLWGANSSSTVSKGWGNYAMSWTAPSSPQPPSNYAVVICPNQGSTGSTATPPQFVNSTDTLLTATQMVCSNGVPALVNLTGGSTSFSYSGDQTTSWSGSGASDPGTYDIPYTAWVTATDATGDPWGWSGTQFTPGQSSWELTAGVPASSVPFIVGGTSQTMQTSGDVTPLSTYLNIFWADNSTSAAWGSSNQYAYQALGAIDLIRDGQVIASAYIPNQYWPGKPNNFYQWHGPQNTGGSSSTVWWNAGLQLSQFVPSVSALEVGDVLQASIVVIYNTAAGNNYSIVGAAQSQQTVGSVDSPVSGLQVTSFTAGSQ